MNRYKLAILVSSLALAGEVQAQPSTSLDPDRCPRAQAEAYLAGNVRARILNNSGLFWQGAPHVYEVPKGRGINAVFSASIWIGGMVENTLLMAATRYGEWEFWPGPIELITARLPEKWY